MTQAIFSRRNILNLATGLCLTGPLAAYASEPARFWEKEDPASWSAQETEQFVTNSPWAKPVDLQLPNASPGATNNRGMGGRSGRMSRGGTTNTAAPDPGPSPKFQGTVRWVSAKIVRDALKMQIPESLAEDYVISVSGLPVIEGSSSDNSYEMLKEMTTLQPKGKDGVQPGTIQPDSKDTSSILFGFLRQVVPLNDVKQVTFSTTMGPFKVKVKFNLKEMLYHGELAV